VDPSVPSPDSLVPILSNGGREELGHLAYHIDRLDRLRGKDVLPDQVHAAALADALARRETILRDGRIEAALQQARRRRSQEPEAALEWARRARALDPQRGDVRDLVTELERTIDLAARLQRAAEPPRQTTKSSDVVYLDASDIIDGPEAASAPPAPLPSLSWKTIAGEFLEEHWQKLILCLAVLLIVVSSTVGAHHLLGERLLWSRAGQCVLAAVYTALFAAFGYGLARWGAERAGRIMLLTTLCVVPVNFSLAGELRLIVLPSIWHMVILICVMIVMFVQIWVVCSALGLRGGGLFPLAYFVLAAFDATAARGVPFDWGFTALVASAWVFVLAVSRLNSQLAKGEATEERRVFAYSALGLLAYAFLFFAYRSGIFVLRLVPELPTLMSVPVVLAAIAVAHTAHVLPRLEKDPRRVHLLRLGAYVLAALAFALALMHPPVRTALLRGNTLTTALLGLGLFAASLAAYRRPPYLYAAFAACWLAYFGVHDIVRDLMDQHFGLLRHALGYRGRLPLPFRALNVVWFNVGLVWLSLVFRRRWLETGLAKHCHYIGLPLSIGACVLSSLEPKAALLCLPIYVALYSAAAWLFAQPLLVYLACGATAGTTWALSRLDPSLTPQARALGASFLGLAFWAVASGLRWRKAAEPYRPPLLHAALVMTLIALVRTGLTLDRLTPEAAATFFVVALVGLLVTREVPQRWLAYYTLANASLGVLVLAAYLTHAPLGDLVASHVALAAVAGWALGMMAMAEGLRTRPAPLFAQALAEFAPLTALIVSLWSLLPLHNDRPLVLTLTLAAATLLWATRFHRQPVLIYLSLTHAVLSTLAAVALTQTWTDPGLTLGWLAFTLAVLALACWAVGVLVRRAGDDGFYSGPCFHTVLGLLPLQLLFAVGARILSSRAFPLSLETLLLGTITLVLLTSMWRLPELTYSAVIMFTVAVYVTLFSAGEARLDTLYVLGLTAVLEGLALWVAGAACLRGPEDWRALYARPLFLSSLALTAFALVPASTHPATLALVGLSCLLAIKSVPSELWLYPAVGAFGAAVYFAWVAVLPSELWMASALGGAYALWTAGVAVQVARSALCRILRLQDRNYEIPLFVNTLASAAIAVFLRWDLFVRLGTPASAYLWLPVGLALLALLMLKAHPHPAWVHFSAGLWTLSLALGLWPELPTHALWLPIGMGVALAWDGLGRVLRRVEGPLCLRLGVGAGEYSSVLGDWGLGTFAASALATIVVVFLAVLVDPGLRIDPRIAWPAVLGAIALGGLAADVLARQERRERLRLGLLVVPPLAAWWLSVGSSPLVRIGGFERSSFLALSTITVALGTVLAGLPAWRARGPRLAIYEENGWRAGMVMALIALIFTFGLVRPTTVGTLLGVTTVFAVVALTRRDVPSGGVAGLAWVAMLSYGTLVLALAFDRIAGPPSIWFFDFSLGAAPAAHAALAAVAAAFSLLGMAHCCAPRPGDQPPRTFGEQLARGLEGVAEIAAAWALVLIVVAVSVASRPAEIAALPVAALFGLALFAALLARRRRAEWPVYLAQALLVAAYFDYRHAFPVRPATDALVLVMFGYIDYAIAETLRRLRLDLYARPVLVFSLVMPFLPLALAGLQTGVLDDVTWFTVFSSAAFYTVAGYTLQRKSLGYAAAVLYNAFLWIAWARVGWKLEDHPQFFLVPVGLSTILFAEANRHDLGRSAVTALRSSGLVIIYLSLALPIWQDQSFGAWLTLLLVSLVGIFLGIGLHVQSFLWLGLGCFCLDVLYQLGRMGMENSLAKWGIMLALGILLILFVAFNEKKRIVLVMRGYIEQVRQWE
jgi:hypothetical protein